MADEKLSAFLETFTTPLHHKKPELGNKIWVFWSKDDDDDDEEGSSADAATIRMIKSAFSAGVYCSHPLILQFWVPITIGDRRLLSTSDQPFSVNSLDKSLAKYRLSCLEHHYNIVKTNDLDIEHHPTMIIAATSERVNFKEHGSILERYALESGLLTSYLLPICCPSLSTSSCVGVVEFSTSYSPFYDFHILLNMKNELENVGLSVLDVQEHITYKDYKANFEAICKTPEIILPQGVIERQFGNTHKEAALNINGVCQVSILLLVHNKVARYMIWMLTILQQEKFKFSRFSKDKKYQQYLKHWNKEENQWLRTTYNIQRQNARQLQSRQAIEQQFGNTMKEAAKNLNVSLSTLKRKSHGYGISEWQGPSPAKRNVNDISNKQRHQCEEYNGVIQNLSAVNKNEDALIVKAEWKGDMIKFHLSILEATFASVEKEIGMQFNLTMGTHKLKYLDEDGDWILLKSDQDMSNCINCWRKFDRTLVRLLVET